MKRTFKKIFVTFRAFSPALINNYKVYHDTQEKGKGEGGGGN